MSKSTGYQDTLFTPGLAILAQRATQAMEMSQQDISPELKKQIDALKKQIDDNNTHASGQIAKLDMSDVSNLSKIQTLLTELASSNKTCEANISTLLAEPSAQAFVWFLSEYGLKVAGERTVSSLADNTVYHVKGVSVCGDKVRYYAFEGDKVTCYASNGKSSETLWAIDKETFAHVWPTSRTSLQRLHYAVYHTSSKSWADVNERLNTVQAHANWEDAAKALGMPKGTDGDKAIDTVTQTVEEFLKAHPVKA